ncbi:MAG: ABC transporter substrate-binding protein [Gammaproteobacteria bacterium]|nr:ABC transporter substrate-binding protein [Gammaproteobacteria bacterium]
MRASLLSSLVFTLFTLVSPVAMSQDVDDPGPVVMDTIKKVLDVLRDTQAKEADKRARVYVLVQEHLDFEGMSRRVLSIEWKGLDVDQRQRFESLFSQIVLGTYWEKIRKYKDERVDYVTSVIEGENNANVDTIIISGNAEIPITYRMEVVDGRWMAYDVLVESLSLVSNYGDEYRSVINSRGVDGLLDRLQAMVNELNAG